MNCLPKVLTNKGFAENALHTGWVWARGLLWSPEDPNHSREGGRARTTKHQSGASREAAREATREAAREDIWRLAE